MSASIRSRLILLVLAVLLPGLLGVGWLVASTFVAEREAHERTLRETARALSLVVDSELARRATIARVLAQSRLLDGAPALSGNDLQQFEQQARRALQDLDGWVELRSADGVLLDTRQPPGTRPAPAPGRLALSQVAQTLPLQRPATAVPGAAQPHAAVVEPVVRGGQVLLNLVVTLRPAELQRIVDRQRLPGDWVAAVLDSQAVVVARHPGGDTFVGRPATSDLQAALQRSTEGLFDSVTLDGMRVTAFYSKSPGGWTFVTGMPRAQFAGLLPSAVRQIVLGALLLLGLAVLGAVWLSRRIVAPVLSLKKAAAQLQAGEAVDYRRTGIVECDEVAGALAEAAQSLGRSRQDLERRVAEAVERTRQAEQRVSQSQRVEALGRLTGGVAHDFNNLLGVISNSAHLMQRHATTPELQMPVAATLRAVEVGSRLTQHLLRFAGRRPVRPQAVQLTRYLPELQDLMRSVLGRHVDVKVRVADDTHAVHVDSGELELALINLALNARDAMASGGELRLQARNARPDDLQDLQDLPALRQGPGGDGTQAADRPGGAQPAGDYVLITVSDDGAGMEPDMAARVFEPFFTTKGVGKGTGLGLSQVHGFCVQAGGTARLDSTPGLGTTVSMVLPAHAPTATGSGAGHGADPAHGGAPVVPVTGKALHGRAVLLVEDNVDLAEVTRQLLTDNGASVVHALDATQALRWLDTGQTFDVVLSDVVMPGPLDGLQLARKLRHDRPDLPVVLISGYVAQRPAVRDFQVLSKPCSQEDLLQALQAVMVRPVQAHRLPDGETSTPSERTTTWPATTTRSTS